MYRNENVNDPTKSSTLEIVTVKPATSCCNSEAIVVVVDKEMSFMLLNHFGTFWERLFGLPSSFSFMFLLTLLIY